MHGTYGKMNKKNTQQQATYTHTSDLVTEYHARGDIGNNESDEAHSFLLLLCIDVDVVVIATLSFAVAK